MVRITVSLLLLTIIGCQNKIETKSMEGTHFKRSTLLVSDIDQSLTIYRDILGFTVHNISESSADSYSYPVFKIPEDATIRFCTLDSPDQVRTMALSEVKGIELPKQVTPHMNASVIRVKDLPTVMEKISALKLQHTQPRIDTSSDGFVFKEQSFIDFDGHLIVIYEMTQ